MTWPAPSPGLVVRYAYLWAEEAERGRDEATKDRPCAVILVLVTAESRPRVRVLPITHSAPENPSEAVELPRPTKERLGLDGERSWIILTEANDFDWPGPDLRPIPGLGAVPYGYLPPALFKVLRERLARCRRRAVTRSE